MKLINRVMLSVAVFLMTQMPLLAGCGAGNSSCGGGGKISLLLLALAVGYGVLVLSQSQQKPLDTLGRIIGGVILVVSIIGLFCIAFAGMKSRCSSKVMCPWSGSAPVGDPAPLAPAAATNP